MNTRFVIKNTIKHAAVLISIGLGYVVFGGIPACQNSENMQILCADHNDCPSGQRCGSANGICEEGPLDGSVELPDLSETTDLPLDLRPAIRRWPRSFGGPNADRVTALGANSRHELYVGGLFSGTIKLSGPAATGDSCTDLTAKGGGLDALLAKYSAEGTCRWALSFGSTLGDEITGIAIDQKDRVVITGAFQETVSIGTGAGCSLTATGGRDIYLAMLDGNGACIWAKSFGDMSEDSGLGVTIDADNNILVTGYFQDRINLGTGVISGGGFEDIFVAKFDSAGKTLGARAFGGSNPDLPTAIVVDSAKRVAITGRYRSEVNFCGSMVGTKRDMYAAFVFELNEDLSCLRAEEFVSSVDARGSVLAAVSGGLIMAGTFKTQVQVGANMYVENGAGKQGDVFVVRLNAGRPDWSLAFGGTAADTVRAITLDKGNNPILVGSFSDQIILPGGKSLISAPADMSDGFAILLGIGAGNVLGARKFGGPAPDAANAALVLGDSLFVAGAFQLEWDSLKSEGDADGFILESPSTF